MSKFEGATIVKYLYDLDKVVLERDGNDDALASYTHEGGRLPFAAAVLLHVAKFIHHQRTGDDGGRLRPQDAWPQSNGC